MIYSLQPTLDFVLVEIWVLRWCMPLVLPSLTVNQTHPFFCKWRLIIFRDSFHVGVNSWLHFIFLFPVCQIICKHNNTTISSVLQLYIPLTDSYLNTISKVVTCTMLNFGSHRVLQLVILLAIWMWSLTSSFVLIYKSPRLDMHDFPTVFNMFWCLRSPLNLPMRHWAIQRHWISFNWTKKYCILLKALADLENPSMKRLNTLQSESNTAFTGMSAWVNLEKSY